MSYAIFQDMYFIWMYAFVICVACVLCEGLVLLNPEQGFGSPETGVTDRFELLCRFWE